MLLLSPFGVGTVEEVEFFPSEVHGNKIENKIRTFLLGNLVYAAASEQIALGATRARGYHIFHPFGICSADQKRGGEEKNALEMKYASAIS